MSKLFKITALLLLFAVCQTASAEPTILYRLRWQYRMTAVPDDVRMMTVVEAEIELSRGGSVMGWGSSWQVARRNVIEAYRRRMDDLKRSETRELTRRTL